MYSLELCSRLPKAKRAALQGAAPKQTNKTLQVSTVTCFNVWWGGFAKPAPRIAPHGV